MFKSSDISVDVVKTFGSKLWLGNVAPDFEYKDGEKTQNVTGWIYFFLLTS